MPSQNELIGVYQLPVTETLVRAQAELLWSRSFSGSARTTTSPAYLHSPSWSARIRLRC